MEMMPVRESYDYQGVPFVQQNAMTDQQRHSLDDLKILLEHSAVARPTIYRVVNNKNMVQSANWILAEVHRTKEISRRARDMVSDFQSLLAYIAQEGAKKYLDCLQLREALDNAYASLQNSVRLELPETISRFHLRQEFGRGKQAYYATEDELRQFNIRGNLIETFYNNLRSAILGDYNPLNLELITQSSRQLTDRFWPLDGKL